MNTRPQNRCGSLWARMRRQDNETPALNALKALRGAPISMGRGEIPVGGCQQPSGFCLFCKNNFLRKGSIMQEKIVAGKASIMKKTLDEKTTYRFGNRSFVVEPVFRKESPDTLGSILLRLMKAESEAK